MHNEKINQQITTIHRHSMLCIKKKFIVQWKNRWFALSQGKIYDTYKFMHKYFNLWLENNAQNCLLSRLSTRFQKWKVQLKVKHWWRHAQMRVECKEREYCCTGHYNRAILRKVLTLWRDIFFRITR